ncbi:hypothetical protein [Kitasatospora sp. NPDC059599]|uniref:hypothetical protein n=1 Tax=Kitasatospora sp. NPDC059599 TaxID=3346880 RepID=UPI0036CBA767
MRDRVLDLGGERLQVPEPGAGEEAGGGDDVQACSEALASRRGLDAEKLNAIQIDQVIDQ